MDGGFERRETVASLEVRYAPGAEVRADGDGLRISGVAVPFMREADIGAFREQFAVDAFDLAATDAILNRQHRRDRVLSRSGAGLTLTATGDALRFAAELVDTAEARDTVALVRAGVLRGASIEFSSIEERWSGDLRTVLKARLSGIAVVDNGAYSTATVSARAQERAAAKAAHGVRMWWR